jgi:Holliday junction DNA helicase RuvA
MIVSVSGRLTNVYRIGQDVRVIIEIPAGVSFEIVTVTKPKQEVGDPSVFMHTWQVFREDYQVLFGFDSLDERLLAEAVAETDGIGPRSAARIVRVCGGPNIATAFRAQKTDVLRELLRGSGIGLKTLASLILNNKVGDLIDRFDGGDVPPLSATMAVRAQAALAELGIESREVDNLIAETIKAVPDITIEKLVGQTLNLVRGLEKK